MDLTRQQAIKDLADRYLWLYGDVLKRWRENQDDLAAWTRLIRR